MNTQVLDLIGWVLVHSTWQFAAIASLAWLLDIASSRWSSTVRHNVLLAALLLMAACPIVTASLVYQVRAPATTAIASELAAEFAVADGPGIILSGVETDDIASEQMTLNAAPTTSGSAESTSVVGQSFHQFDARSVIALIARWIDSWLAFIVVVWCMGVVLFAIRLSVGWWRVRRLISRSSQVNDETLQSLLSRAADSLCIRRRLRLLVSATIESPIVVGVLRSTIVIPSSFASGVSPDLVEAIFAHELAHVQRYDYAINLIQSVLETLFFYHPSVWWLSRRIREERENCCDDIAAAALQNPVTVGRALLTIEELRGRSLAPALGAEGGTLVNRVRRLLGKQPGQKASGNAVSLAALGVLVALVIAVTGLVIADAAELAEADDESDDESDDRYAVVFDQGKSLELVAVKRHPSGEAWKADGSRLGESLELPDVPGNAATRAVEGFDLFFKFDGLNDIPIPVYEGDHRHTMWNPNQDAIAIIPLDPPEDAMTTQITVGIPESRWGPWRVVDVEGGNSELVAVQERYQDAYRKMIVHDIQQRSESLLVRWAYDRETENLARMEFVAVTNDGKRLRRDGATLWDDENGTTRSADVFRTSVGDIDHFEYRLCPIRYRLTFKNISLRPGQKTNVKVGSERVAMAHSDGVSVLPNLLLPESRNVKSIQFAGNSSIRSLAYGEGNAKPGSYPRIRKWDLETRKMLAEIPLQWEKRWTRYTSQLILAAERDVVFGSLGNELASWDATTGKLLRRMKPKWEEFGDLTLRHVVATPPGHRVACSGLSNSTLQFPDGHIYVWNAETGELVREIESERTGYVRSFAMSDDGKYVAAWPAKEGVGIWDVESGEQIFQFKNQNPPGSWPREPMHPSIPDQVLGLQFSHDARTLAVGDLVGVKLVDTETGEVRQTIRAPLRYDSPVFVFSPDDRLLLRYGAYFENRRESLLWDVQSGEQVAVLPIEGTAATFSPEGGKLAIGRSDPRQAIAVWKLNSGSKSNGSDASDVSADPVGYESTNKTN